MRGSGTHVSLLANAVEQLKRSSQLYKEEWEAHKIDKKKNTVESNVLHRHDNGTHVHHAYI